MAEISKSTIQDAHNHARDILIGYLCQPPYETEEALREAVTALGSQLDLSYEATLKLLLTGTRSA